MISMFTHIDVNLRLMLIRKNDHHIIYKRYAPTKYAPLTRNLKEFDVNKSGLQIDRSILLLESLATYLQE